MKHTLFSLVAFLVLSSTSAFAQFSSSPVEPGLSDHLKNRSNTSFEIINEKKMVINGIDAEWISHDQITLSAIVLEAKSLNSVSRDRIAQQLLEYNTTGPVGTLSMSNDGTVRMMHHVNPRFVTPDEIASTVDVFKAALELERANLDKSMAVR